MSQTNLDLLLRNAHMTATVLRPDPQVGTYRGARFVWSGMIGPVVCGGHTFMTPWSGRPDPHSHDGSSIGTAGEFRGPLGYDDARPGEGFVKVGVGVLERADDGPYRFSHPYRIVDNGTWEVEADDRAARFVHTLDGPGGRGYRLETLVRLDEGPGFGISHTLTNTGQVALDTDHYDHHFFNIDDCPIGPETTLTFPFDAVARPSFDHGAVVEGGVLRLPAPLGPGQQIGANLDGPLVNGATFTDHRSGASIAFTGDRPLSGYYVWGMARCLCPEPYVAVRVAPGETFAWSEAFTLHTGD